jgi:hypothetical protein
MFAPLLNLFYVAGVFGIVLGILHFFFPFLFDFRGAIAPQGDALKPFPLLITRYNTTRQDIYGLVWVMNNAASFSILSIGILDLFWREWLSASYGQVVTLWIGAFYFIRAASQLYMGRRRGDWLILAAFGALGAFHVLAIFF